MYAIKALAVVVTFSLTRSILALPTDTSAAAAVPADPISKYTVDFFLNNVKTTPTSSSCVFFTEGLTSTAQAFAVKEVKVSIWNIWNCGLYKPDQVDTNPLRDIMKRTENGEISPDTRTYFEHMSEAYAALCSGTATLLTKNPNSVDMSGIWGQVEFPRLQKTGNPGGQVNRVDACDENGSNCLKFWGRSNLRKLRRSVSVPRPAVDGPESEKRQVGNCPLCDPLPEQCYTPEELGEIFSDLDKLG